MNRKLENRLGMFHKVLYFFKANEAIFNPIAHFGPAIAELKAITEDIQTEEIKNTSDYSGATIQKNELREKVEKLCSKVGSAVRAYGANNGQLNILDASDYLQGNLTRVGDSELYVLAVQLYRKADPIKGFLAPYGSGTADVAQLNTQSSAFVDQIHVPRGYRKVRTLAVQQIAALFKQADEPLQKLDAYMAVYQHNHYTLFLEYKSARAIDNRPSGHTVHKKRGRVLPGFVAHAAFREGILKPATKLTLYNTGKKGDLAFYFSARAAERPTETTKLTIVSPGKEVTIKASEAGYTPHLTQLNIHNSNVLHGQWKAVVER